jgi:ATP-dependent 26S proteasome regulatory subunit
MEKLSKYLNFELAKKYFSLNIIAFISGGLLIMFLTKSPSNIDIKELKLKNDSLLLANRKLAQSNDSLKNNIDKSALVIETLNKKDGTYKEKVGQLNNKIQSLKGKYEEANNHANNFGSLDIQRYFSELK